MQGLLQHLLYFFPRLGGLGLIALGIIDSSALFFLPLGNDLLVTAMTAARPKLLFYYAGMAATGSVIGCFVTDAISRKGGEAGLEKRVPRRRLNYVKRKVGENAAFALAFASLMPPPFPFTLFVIAGAALQYPRKKLLGVVAAARFARFSLIGLIAVLFGRRILYLAQQPAVQYAILGLVVISIAGSAVTVTMWFRRGRQAVHS